MRRSPLVLAMLLAVGACTQATEQTTTTTGTATTIAGGGQVTGDTLAAVQERGSLNCGVNELVPGFGFRNPDGTFSGFDIDFCKAVAAAVLGDAEAVNFVSLTAQQRFTALQAGEIDVLIRNTTWTATRDGSEGATFLHTTFFDGQGMMVRADSGFTTIEDMANTAVCTLSGTTTELNLATRFGAIPFTPLTFEDNELIQSAFIAGQCEGWTSDKSQLAAVRSAFPQAEGGPEALVILDETFSKEPLGPVVRDGDSQWAQIVDWVALSTIIAEELGIDSANVNTFGDTENVEIRRLLGLEITTDEGTTIFDPGLGVEPGWVVGVISAVGNYAEIYDRNVTPLGVPRGVNSLWTEGGLLYAPPYR
ncbi:MAG TPA: amino acid ABC transporter substrate-binding protein [Acidimicrobiia bacterium]|nr:amino acid ABC transporter substrate-binding protein [Acidimicrobiia bacterium]